MTLFYQSLQSSLVAVSQFRKPIFSSDGIYGHSHVIHNGFSQISNTTTYQQWGTSKRSGINQIGKKMIFSASSLNNKNVDIKFSAHAGFL